MHLQDILYTQGFGTRRVCAGLAQQGHVTIGGQAVTDPFADLDPEGLLYTVQGTPWAYHEKAYLMLHKPAGTECSQKPSTYPSIYTLLPSPLRLRPNKGAVQGVQAIGRLDQDTTGLLLLTDDGQFIHKMGSPKHHVPKGKYHQVKRMLAAVGNRVEGLHRSRIGDLALPAELAPGQWRWLTADEVAGLRAPAKPAKPPK
jgi:16S rRNA pseudouridine516 synthase